MRLYYKLGNFGKVEEVELIIHGEILRKLVSFKNEETLSLSIKKPNFSYIFFKMSQCLRLFITGYFFLNYYLKRLLF